MEKRIIIDAGPRPRRVCPVCFRPRKRLNSALITEAKTGREVPSQVDGNDIWLLLDGLEAEKKYEYIVTDGAECRLARVGLRKNRNNVLVTIGDQPFCSYNFGIKSTPKPPQSSSICLSKFACHAGFTMPSKILRIRSFCSPV